METRDERTIRQLKSHIKQLKHDIKVQDEYVKALLNMVYCLSLRGHARSAAIQYVLGEAAKDHDRIMAELDNLRDKGLASKFGGSDNEPG